MAGEVLFSIPKAVTVKHHAEARACVAHWEALSSPRFREAVERGLNECGRLGARTWIVDLSGKDPGVPTQSDIAWIATDAVEIAQDNGIVAVVNVHGKSAVASMGAKRWNKIASEGGLATYDCKTLKDALELAKELASAKEE